MHTSGIFTTGLAETVNHGDSDSTSLPIHSWSQKSFFFRQSLSYSRLASSSILGLEVCGTVLFVYAGEGTVPAEKYHSWELNRLAWWCSYGRWCLAGGSRSQEACPQGYSLLLSFPLWVYSVSCPPWSEWFCSLHGLSAMMDIDACDWCPS